MEKIWPGIQHIFPGKIPGIEKVISTLYVTENPKPTTKKNFFIVDSKTCRVIWGFEQLSSAGDIAVQRHTCKLLVFTPKQPSS